MCHKVLDFSIFAYILKELLVITKDHEISGYLSEEWVFLHLGNYSADVYFPS